MRWLIIAIIIAITPPILFGVLLFLKILNEDDDE